MSKKPSEWISIADLMSGVMAVVMLLLVISVLQNTYAELKHKQEIEQNKIGATQNISTLIKEIQTAVDSIGEQEANEFIEFNLGQGKITLRDGVFASGSACITPEAKIAFGNIGDKLKIFLQQSASSKIFVEGHTDNIPVARPVIDYQNFCTVYDDNYTLSAARAREARKLLIGQLDPSLARRIVVAGYGDSQPLEGVSADNQANRRVEVRFSITPD